MYFIDYNSDFKKSIKQLKKKYPNCIDVIEGVISDFEVGKFIGEDCKNLGLEQNKAVKKCRIKNIDSQKGKSGGFRLIYYIDYELKYVNMLQIYSKNNTENILYSEIKQMLKELSLE